MSKIILHGHRHHIGCCVQMLPKVYQKPLVCVVWLKHRVLFIIAEPNRMGTCWRASTKWLHFSGVFCMAALSAFAQACMGEVNTTRVLNKLWLYIGGWNREEFNGCNECRLAKWQYHFNNEIRAILTKGVFKQTVHLHCKNHYINNGDLTFQSIYKGDKNS